jgi:hypothetical protein
VRQLRRPKQPGLASPWTSPPQEPARYRLGARLSDMAHGWLDGRGGVPQLTEAPGPPGGAAFGPGTPADSASPTEPGPVGPPPVARTSRMEVLGRMALGLIHQEEIRLYGELAVLRREFAGFVGLRDALSDELAELKQKLKEAQRPLSGQELEVRRLAEQDARSRPAELVRGRRQTAWERRLAAVEQQHQSVTTRLADANRQAQLRAELIRDREAVARAAARQHHELGLRRIATYQQQLVRRHRDGAALNRLLDHPVGPDLPEWARDRSQEDGGSAR